MSNSLISKRFNDLIFFLIDNNEIKNKTELSRIMEVSQSRITEICKNRMGLTSEMLIKLADIFNVDSHWLLTGYGSMFKVGKYSQVIADCTNCSSKDQVIRNLNRLIDIQNIKISELDKLQVEKNSNTTTKRPPEKSRKEV